MNNSRLTNRRLDYIVILKGITILLVVMGHFCPIGSPHSWYLLKDIIYSFHMPLFMIISGYLYAYSSRIESLSDYTKFVTKKCKRLVIPYLAISAFVLSVKFLAGKFVHLEHPIPMDWYWHLFFNPVGGFATFLWFIYALFIIFLIFPLINLKIKNPYCLFGLFLALFFLKAPEFFCLNLVFKFIFFFYFGVFLCQYPVTTPQRKSLLVLSCVIFSMIFLIKKGDSSDDGYFNNALNLILALSGSFALWVFVFFIEDLSKKLLKPFVLLGLYSAPIYLFHTAAMNPVKLVLKKTYMHSTEGFYLCACLIIAMGVLVPIFITKFIFDKNRVLALAFLGQETK